MMNSDGHPHCVLPQNMASLKTNRRSPSAFDEEPLLESAHSRVVPLIRRQVSFLEDLLGDG